MFASFRSARPALWVRLMLVAEVLIVTGGMAMYLLFLLPLHKQDTRWYHVVIPLVLMAVGPISLNLLHGDRPADSGIRLDTLAGSAREVGLATLAMAAGLTALALWMGGFTWKSWPRLAEMGGGYLAWGLMQQYLLQAFVLRRLLQSGLPKWPAVAAAAALFGLMHAPNWGLVAASAGGAVVWCHLFLRRPNLLTLGASHAALAVLLYHAFNHQLMALTVGRMYIHHAWH
jgi:membrane protease YdiL (CAAX protease family)